MLLALIVLVLAALPLITSGMSIHHRSYFTEFHVLAAVRARTLLGLVSAMDFETVHRALRSNSSGIGSLDLAAMFEPGTVAFLLAAPGSINPLYVRKMTLLTHQIRGRILSRNLIEIDVVVQWTIPAERKPTPHVHRLGLLLHRPESTMNGET